MWTSGLLSYVKMIPDSVDDQETLSDAIVVLTGGSERLKQGLKLPPISLSQCFGHLIFQITLATTMDFENTVPSY